MRKPKVVVIGSSVALGYYAEFGWAARLQVNLNSQITYVFFLKGTLEKRGWDLVNLSVPGADTFVTFDRFLDLVPQLNPDIVIIALSLANEGLMTLGADAVVTYLQNISKMISIIVEIGAIPMLAGVYPHNQYSPTEYQLLKHTKQKMEDPNLGWRQKEVECVFDFLT